MGGGGGGSKLHQLAIHAAFGSANIFDARQQHSPAFLLYPSLPLCVQNSKREHHTYVAQWSPPYAWELATEQLWSVMNHLNNISGRSEQCFSLLTWLPVWGAVVCIGSLYDTAPLFLSLQSSLSSISTTPSVQFWELLEPKHTQLSFVDNNYPFNKQTILVFYSGRYTHEMFCLNIVRRGKLWLETRRAPSLVMTSLCFLAPFPKKMSTTLLNLTNKAGCYLCFPLLKLQSVFIIAKIVTKGRENGNLMQSKKRKFNTWFLHLVTWTLHVWLICGDLQWTSILLPICLIIFQTRCDCSSNCDGSGKWFL